MGTELFAPLPGGENRVRIVLNLIQIGYVLGEYDQTLEFLRGEGSFSALVSEPGSSFANIRNISGGMTIGASTATSLRDSSILM